MKRNTAGFDLPAIAVRDQAKGRSLCVLATVDFARSESTSFSWEGKIVLGQNNVMWFALSKRLILTRKTTKITRSVMSRFGMLFFLFLLLLSQSSNAQDFIGWPNFNPAPDTIKNPETDTEAADRPKKAPLLHKQIDWQPWKDMSMYRYRTGSRYAGRKNGAKLRAVWVVSRPRKRRLEFGLSENYSGRG